MARKVIQVALNGVTGRMGYRQHLVRSLLAIREQGGITLDDGTVLYPEPVLVGRSEDRLRAIAERHGLPRWTTSLDEVLGDPDIDVYFDTQVTSARETALAQAIAAGKHIYTEKPLAASAAAAFELAEAAQDRGHHPRHRPGQAVPARRDQAAPADPRGVLRPGAVGPARVRLLGVRRGRDAGPAPVLELPRGRRRRHRARHVPALALPPGGPVRPGQLGLRPPGDAPAQAVGRGGRAVRRDRRRRRLRDPGVRQRRRRVGELLLGGPRQPPRAARAPGGRHPRQRGGGAAQLRRPAQGVHPDAGLEPRPARPARLSGDVDRRAGQHRVRQRLQGAVGAVPAGRRAGQALPVGPVRRRQGRPAGRARAAVVRRGPPGRDPRCERETPGPPHLAARPRGGA